MTSSGESSRSTWSVKFLTPASREKLISSLRTATRTRGSVARIVPVEVRRPALTQPVPCQRTISRPVLDGKLGMEVRNSSNLPPSTVRRDTVQGSQFSPSLSKRGPALLAELPVPPDAGVYTRCYTAARRSSWPDNRSTSTQWLAWRTPIVVKETTVEENERVREK